MDSHLPSNLTESWTNEKHVRFLNSMEASFVRTMLENNGRLLRLNRYLPDISESTIDLKTQRREKHPISVDLLRTRTRMNSSPDKRSRRSLSSHTDDSSKDQVVPQLENRRDDKDE